MKKLLRIMAVVVCVLFIAVVPQVGASGNHGGGWGGGHDGGHGGWSGGHDGGHGGWGGGHGGAPEIDLGAASSAIGLLTCGLLILMAKRKRKGRKTADDKKV